MHKIHTLLYNIYKRGVDKVISIERKKTREVLIKGIKIGGNSPIVIQSMTNTDTRDSSATINQIKSLAEEGCEIVRCAVPDMEAAEAIKEIVLNSPISVVADIHFDYRLALKCIENGISKIRINPGNIGSMERVQMVANACKKKNIPIRIGVNSGSLSKDILNKYSGVTPEGLVESALEHVSILEKVNFNDIVISIKSSDVLTTIESYRLLSEKVDYPLHLGVTEAGTTLRGAIKSSIGIGTLLYLGIGDTIRVSLTADPIEEISAAKEILKSLGLKKEGIVFVSCPTCGRTEVDLIKISQEIEEKLKGVKKNIKLAIMGCIVNGPGESRDADIGIAAGKGEALIFKRGEIIKKVKESEIIPALMEEINNF